MPLTSNNRKSRNAPSLTTKNDLLELLNDDMTRECRAIYAHAVFAERLKGVDETLAAEISRLGKECVLSALGLCQIIYDYGGTVSNQLDELNAVLNADRVADTAWHLDTLRRLHERIGQLRAAGEPGLSKRLRRILAVKREMPALRELLATRQCPIANS